MLARTCSLLVCLLVGCPGGGGPARKIEPKTPNVATADPTMKPPSIEACKTPASHDLMVIDWTPELRTDLEVAMKEGMALVSYDCKSVKVVSCAVEGSYGFIGTTRNEKKIELNDAEEVAANLPVGGLTWLSDVSGKIARDRALLAQLTMIGKRSAGKKKLDPGELSSCTGATHYVQAATIGAFAVAAGTKAELAASLKLMGKGASGDSKSSTKIEAKAGVLADCEKSTPDAKAPPGECGAIVRVQLVPVTVQAGANEDLAVATCAEGFAMADGKCVRLDKPHQCKPGDAADCLKQCEAGNADSCATLAVMYRDGAGAAKDGAKAAAAGKKACDKDSVVGCRVAATASKDPKAAIQLLVKSCQAGDGKGCVELGVAQLKDKATAGDAQYSFRRACYGGGEVEGCAWLGTLYVEGKGGLSASPKLASAFLEKGCKDGSGRACFTLAELLKDGKGVKKDAARAKELFAKACKNGHEPACKK